MNALRFKGVPRFRFSTLVIPDPNRRLADLKPLLRAGGQLKQKISILSLGKNAADTPKLLQPFEGKADIAEVFTAQHDGFNEHDYETSAAFIAGFLAKHKFDNVLMGNSAISKEILPRLSVPFNSQPISDVISIESPDTFKRPIYAGNAISTVQSAAPVKFIGIRLTNFQDDLAGGAQGGQIKVTELQAGDFLPKDFAPKLQVISNEIQASERPELSKAKVVLSGGRALKSAENFKMLFKLADKFKNCAVGASRAAVDAGYCSNDLQVGQTGKIVAPDLYIALGISGAIQHVAGMKDSKVIVAINNNADAPIFQIADYGLVGDLFKVIPELEQKL